MANPSAENVIDLSRSLLREDAFSDIPAIGDTVMLQGVAKADRDALQALRRGGGNTPVSQGLEGGNTLASNTAVNNASGVLKTDVTVTVDSTSGYDSAGAAAIWTKDMPDVFYYTSISATQFLGVTGLGFAHADNDVVQPLYALPSNFGNFRKSEDYGDGAQVNGDSMKYIDGVPQVGQFSKKDDGTTKYLWLYLGATGTCSYLFDKDSNTIDSTDDLISLPEDWLYFYAWTVIALCLFGRGDYELVNMAKAEAKEELLAQLKDRNIGRSPRIRKYGRVGTDDFSYSLALRENAI